MSDERVVVETPCLHRELGPHVITEWVDGVKKVVDECTAGSRRTLTPGEIHEAISWAIAEYSEGDTCEPPCDIARYVVQRLGLGDPGGCYPFTRHYPEALVSVPEHAKEEK